MQLMIDNLPPDVNREDLLALLEELGFPPPSELTIAEGLRDRPSAALSLDLDHAEMEAAARLLDGRVWKNHTLHASHATLFR